MLVTTLWKSLLLVLSSTPPGCCVSVLRRQFDNNFPDPEPCAGDCSNLRDPSIVSGPDGNLYRMATYPGGGPFSISSAPGIEGPWSRLGYFLEDGTVIRVVDNQRLWSPDCHLIGSLYHCFYSVSYFGVQASEIGYATSESLQPGTWTDHGPLGIPFNDAYNKIDSSYDEQSSAFTFGSYFTGLYQTFINSDGNSWNSDAPVFNVVGEDRKDTVEGSFLFPWEGYYYLFFSAGICCSFDPNNLPAAGDEYKIMVCRSDSIWGPYTDRDGRDCVSEQGGTLVLGSHGNVYAPGGQGVTTAQGDPVLYYHYTDLRIGFADADYQFGHNHLSFDGGWPVVG